MKHAKLIPCALVSVSVLLAGCTAPVKSADAKAPVKAAEQQDYVQVNSMGSWIPRKVKKKSDYIGDSTQSASGDALDKSINQGMSHVARDPDLAAPSGR